MTPESDLIAPEARAPRRRGLLTALGILALGFLSVVVLVATRPRPARAVLERPAPRVSTLTLQERSGVISVEGSGTIRPRAEISLSPQVGGRVVEVSPSLSSGGSFRRGDVLMVIEQASYRNAVAIAESDVAQRLVDIALAEQEQVVAREEYRLLRARTATATAPDTARSTRLALREPQVEAARAALARAEAQLADARLDLDRTVLRAPFNGRVRSETVDVGQNVSPGQVVAQLFDTDEAEMVVSLSQAEAALIDGLWDRQAGDGSIAIPARIRHDFGGVRHEWDGYLDRVEGALDPTTRTINAIVRIPKPFASAGRPPLLIGSYARALIAAREIDRYFALPRPALREGDQVWVLQDGGTLTSSPVSVLREVQDTVYVTSDLPSGTRVVTSDLTIMTEGMSVSVTGDGAS
jgi:RND family efflux transporter MFP subunit